MHDDADSTVAADARPLRPRPSRRTSRSELAQAFAEHDKPAFVRTAVEAVTSGAISIPKLYRDVLTPLLVQAGASWQHGRLTIWEEHLASAMVRTVVEIVYPGVLKAKAAVPPAGAASCWPARPKRVTTSVCAWSADRFDMAGWTTYFLGADTPVDDVADAARRLGVDALVLSSSTHYHRVALRRAVDQLRAAAADRRRLGRRPGFRARPTAGRRRAARSGSLLDRQRICPAMRARAEPC